MKIYYDTYKELLENMKGGEYGGHDGIGWYKLNISSSGRKI